MNCRWKPYDSSIM